MKARRDEPTGKLALSCALGGWHLVNEDDLIDALVAAGVIEVEHQWMRDGNQHYLTEWTVKVGRNDGAPVAEPAP